jgi:hypothetical protein
VWRDVSRVKGQDKQRQERQALRNAGIESAFSRNECRQVEGILIESDKVNWQLRAGERQAKSMAVYGRVTANLWL